jgi:cell division protein FtsL
MDVEWGQLQLELSTLTTHGRVEKNAGERMHMSIPAPDSVVILRQ